MFEYIKKAYNTMKDYYHTYSYSSNPRVKINRFSAFFKAIFSYIFGRPKPVILSDEQRNRFEKGLGNLIYSYKIEYGPGSIVLKPRGLEKRI